MKAASCRSSSWPIHPLQRRLKPGKVVNWCALPLVPFTRVRSAAKGLLILAREIALTSNHPLLHDLVILFAPLMNADGNERMHPHNRPGQDGPEQGMGTRLNAMGLNLNRDWTVLETPENRAFARLMSAGILL